MFNFLKQKPIDRERAINNTAHVILQIWADNSTLSYKKFRTQYPFTNNPGADEKIYDHFMKEKLRFLTSVGISVLKKDVESEDNSSELVSVINQKIIENELADTKDMDEDLCESSKEMADVRFGSNARTAGRQIEDNFSKAVFNVIPDESDIDARYLLYKQLSALERAAIFKIKSSLRM